MPREGSLLPETYKIPARHRAGTGNQGIPEDAASAYLRKSGRVDAIKGHSDQGHRTSGYLASIRREGNRKRPTRRSRVAAVFVNQLEAKKKLQFGPTINLWIASAGKGTPWPAIKRSANPAAVCLNNTRWLTAFAGPIANPAASLGSRSHSGAYARSVFRRRRLRWPCLYRTYGTAPGRMSPKLTGHGKAV